EGFYSMSEHRWPDIRIDFYLKTKDGHWQYSKHSIVFDAKFSRFRNLFRETIPIKAFTQLNAYLTIQHTSSMKTVVDRVCCLFAGDGESDAAIRKHSLTYIRLLPEEHNRLTGNSVLKEFLLE